MKLTLSIAILALLSIGRAEAHFFYLIPAETANELRLVLSDGPSVDREASFEPFTLGKPEGKSAAGSTQALTLKTISESEATVTLPTNDMSEVSISVPYRVVQRGSTKSIFITHSATWADPRVPAADPKNLKGLHIDTIARTGGFAFRVTNDGKPAVKMMVLVHQPSSKKVEMVRTDANGLTKTFTEKGLHAARVWEEHDAEGEYQGYRYQAIREYVTLCVMQ